MTSLEPATKLMAHLPLWLAEDPREALVVCFGMGTTVRSASRHEGLQVWAVELVPGVLECFGHYWPASSRAIRTRALVPGVLECFGHYHRDGPELLRRPDIHVVVDDGRNFLLMHPRRYDVITVDPAPPVYSAGAVHLYSLEFFRLCQQRIRLGGVVCLWLPPANQSEIMAIMRTFLEAFEHVSVWEGLHPEAVGRGFYLLGTLRPLRGVEAKIRAGYRKPAVVADLLEWGDDCDRPEKVLALRIADRAQLREFVADAPIITNDRPYTEFPLWRTLFGGEDYHTRFTGPRLRACLRADAAKKISRE